MHFEVRLAAAAGVLPPPPLFAPPSTAAVLERLIITVMMTLHDINYLPFSLRFLLKKIKTTLVSMGTILTALSVYYAVFVWFSNAKGVDHTFFHDRK